MILFYRIKIYEILTSRITILKILLRKGRINNGFSLINLYNKILMKKNVKKINLD